MPTVASISQNVGSLIEESLEFKMDRAALQTRMNRIKHDYIQLLSEVPPDQVPGDLLMLCATLYPELNLASSRIGGDVGLELNRLNDEMYGEALAVLSRFQVT